MALYPYFSYNLPTVPIGKLAVRRIFRTTAHALLFMLAIVACYLGLGVDLQRGPAIGTILRIAAGANALLNLSWIFRSRLQLN